MSALRTVLCLVIAATAALWSPVAAAQSFSAIGRAATDTVPDTPPRGMWLPGERSYLGLNVGRARYNVACGTTALLCDDTDRPTQLYTGLMLGNFWGVEVGYLNLGRIAGAGRPARAQGLNLSLIGKAPLGRSVGLFGKVGTIYGRADTSAMGVGSSNFAMGEGFGLSYGAGLSLEFTPRLSATIEWDSNEFRFASGGRDSVRSTSLGLQYRY